jgi:hypothetical protein
MAALLGGGAFATASDKKFEVVAFASLASTDELTADMEALGGLIANPSLGKALIRLLATQTGVRHLPGLDRKRQCGAAIVSDGLRVAPVFFVPATDVKQLLTALEPLVGPAEKQADQPTRVWKIGSGQLTGYVSQHGGWAFLTQTADLLEHSLTSQQIDEEMRRLPAGHDLAVRFYPPRIPEALRTFGVDLLREQIHGSADPGDAGSDNAAAARQRLRGLLLEMLESSLADQQQVTWSWTFDRNQKQSSLELQIVPLADGPLARQLGACQKLSGPALLQPEPDLLRLHAGLQVESSLVERLAQMARDIAAALRPANEPLDELQAQPPERPSDTPPNDARQVLSSLIEPAFHDGRLQCDLAVTGAALPVTALLALPASDSASLSEVLDRIATAERDVHAGSPTNNNQQQIAGRPVYSLRFHAGDTPPLIQRCFGAAATCRLTKADQFWLLAGGPRSGTVLEQAIAGGNRVSPSPAANKSEPAIQLSIHAGGVASLLESALVDRRQALLLSLVGANLRAADDRLVLTMEPTRESFEARLVFHEGILRAAAMGLNVVALEALSQPAIKTAPAPRKSRPR